MAVPSSAHVIKGSDDHPPHRAVTAASDTPSEVNRVARGPDPMFRELGEEPPFVGMAAKYMAAPGGGGP